MSSVSDFVSRKKNCLRQYLFPQPGLRSSYVAQPEAHAGFSGLTIDGLTDPRQFMVSITGCQEGITGPRMQYTSSYPTASHLVGT